MGHFASLKEYNTYIREHCARCIHYIDGDPRETCNCPVLGVHWLINITLAPFEFGDMVEWILNALLTQKEGHNSRCTMFMPAELLTEIKRLRRQLKEVTTDADQ